MKKQKLIILTTVLIIAILALAGCGGGGSTVTLDLNDYIEYEFSGRNEAGEISLTLDVMSLAVDMWGDAETSIDKTDDEKKLKAAFEKQEAFFDIADSIELLPNKETDLSNGEEIIVLVKYDEELAKESKIKFETKIDPIVVSGLEEMKIVDIFDYAIIETSGSSPYIQVNVKGDGNRLIDIGWYAGYKFTTDKPFYKSGETAVITAEYDKDKLHNASYMKTKSDTKEITIESKYEYVSDPAAIGADNYAVLKNEAIDKIKAELVEEADMIYWSLSPDTEYGFSYYKPTAQLVEEPKVMESYLLNLKQGLKLPSNNNAYNAIVIPFELTVTYVEEESDINYNLYYALYCNEIIMDDTGKVTIDISTLKLTDYQKTPQTHYENLVTAHMGSYEITTIDPELIG